VVLCTLGAAAWWAFSSIRFEKGRPVLVDKIHNPGPVTRAHAQIEHDCKACHDGGDDTRPRDSAYWLNVSDAACVKCHDGSLHHANQKLADSHLDVDAARLVLAVKDPKHPHGATSASCISCHIEHRGHDALAGTSDRHCIACHADVDRALAGGAKRESAARVIAFTPADHPRFGRKLAAPGTASASGDFDWVDSTNLKFGHKRHIEKSAAKDCVGCHAVGEPAPRPSAPTGDPEKDDKLPPPYAVPGDAFHRFAVDTEQAYVGPVEYARHCVACHVTEAGATARNLKVKLGDAEVTLEQVVPKTPVDHVELALVRGQIESAVRRVLDGKLTGKSAGGGGGGGAGPARRPRTGPGAGGAGAAPAGPVVVPVDAWVRANIEWAAQSVNKDLKTIPGYETASLPLPTTGAPATQSGDAGAIEPAVLVDYLTALVAVKNCYTCHTLEGDLPGLDAAKNAADANRLRTAPTGIPDEPRRWFPASEFDHYAHRQMDCRGCHAPAWASGPSGEKGNDALASTRQVLTADIDGRYSGATALNVAAAAQSCVSCHHADTRHARGAPSNCVTCHGYHDAALERTIDNPFAEAVRLSASTAPPATQPAATGPR
jgi:hypothetical protein